VTYWGRLSALIVCVAITLVATQGLARQVFQPPVGVLHLPQRIQDFGMSVTTPHAAEILASILQTQIQPDQIQMADARVVINAMFAADVLPSEREHSNFQGPTWLSVYRLTSLQSAIKKFDELNATDGIVLKERLHLDCFMAYVALAASFTVKNELGLAEAALKQARFFAVWMANQLRYHYRWWSDGKRQRVAENFATALAQAIAPTLLEQHKLLHCGKSQGLAQCEAIETFFARSFPSLSPGDLNSDQELAKRFSVWYRSIYQNHVLRNGLGAGALYAVVASPLALVAGIVFDLPWEFVQWIHEGAASAALIAGAVGSALTVKHNVNRVTSMKLFYSSARERIQAEADLCSNVFTGMPESH
jgi:hypothetical protein